jgi:A/G-specific adenine glycosylase
MTRGKRIKLQNIVWDYYQTHGRHNLPWRHSIDPYRIAVSEIMLQQTQVTRVLPRYSAFLRRFSNTKQLAEASLGAVLAEWQGLGYNRRAKLLHQSAVCIRQSYNGRWPRTAAGLETLPGFGAYTAGAVAAFAYNEPVVLLETNIKAVLLVHCYEERQMATPSDLYTLAGETLDATNPREWYWALMDYGAYLKTKYPKINHRVAGYRTQAPFRGSDREVRGMIIRCLAQHSAYSLQELCEQSKFPVQKVRSQINNLCTEGMVEYDKRTQTYQLPYSHQRVSRS